MFSFEDGVPVCVVKGGSADKEIIFLQGTKSDEVIKGKTIRKISVEDGKFEQVPSEEVRVLYIAGPSGSGKSTYVVNYAQKYLNLYPDSKVILFSRVESDPAFDNLEHKRIVLSEDLVENPLQLEEVTPGALVIFDDVDTISNTALLKSIQNFELQCLEMGRHKGVKCVITSHLINGNCRKQTRTILNEQQSLTVFPGSGSFAQIKYVLERYYGLTSKQIKKIQRDIDSRWVTILKAYPQVLLSEHECVFLSELKDE